MTIHTPILTNKAELKFFFTLGIILALLLSVTIIAERQVRRGNTSVPAKVAKDSFEGINLTANAAYVYDVRTKTVLYSKNADKRLPLASLTKVMTATVALDLASKDSIVVVTNEALRAEGDSGLRAGERWSLKKLLDFSLTSSSNDGARAVALALGALHKTNPTEEDSERDFINSMNMKASELQMKNTYFFNETGLDESTTKGGAYGTAKDMTTLFEYILKEHPDLLEATQDRTVRVTSLDNISHVAENTDQIVENIPGIKASKTGFTDIAGGNLVIAFDPELGRPIIISVLGSTAAERFTDVEQLVTRTLEALRVDTQE
jgi:serine-type D-Ala-D-Ala carboxypeptidase (penicillin-binding protein 5/6)